MEESVVFKNAFVIRWKQFVKEKRIKLTQSMSKNQNF